MNITYVDKTPLPPWERVLALGRMVGEADLINAWPQDALRQLTARIEHKGWTVENVPLLELLLLASEVREQARFHLERGHPTGDCDDEGDIQ